MSKQQAAVIAELERAPAPHGMAKAGGAREPAPHASLNFSVAKVLAIWMVVAGHWFPNTILWLPVTFGLFVFGFSSAYFTSKKYGAEIDIGRFWRNKLERLGLRYWVILAFLSVVVGLRGKTLLHWHTLAHFMGLSGFLNWFSVRNASGLGAGLWFFTLLLLFYLTYPYLARACRAAPRAWAIAGASTVAAVYLENRHNVGHELWLTSLGFILGVIWGAHELRVRASWAGAAMLLGVCALLAANAAGYKEMNTALIALTGIAIALWLSKAHLPRLRLFVLLSRLEGYLLEIFLIHTYFFFHPTGVSALDLAISIFAILAAAIAVNRAARAVAALVFRRHARLD